LKFEKNCRLHKVLSPITLRSAESVGKREEFRV
jgi:hypothetical protein